MFLLYQFLAISVLQPNNNYHVFQMSMCVRKPTIWVATRSDTSRPAKRQKKKARSMKFRILEEEELHRVAKTKALLRTFHA